MREHIRYITGRRRLPLNPPKEPTREDSLFGDLRRAVTKPQLREQHRIAWVSEETWRLVDERVTMRRKARARMGMRKLGRAIQASMKGGQETAADLCSLRPGTSYHKHKIGRASCL